MGEDGILSAEGTPAKGSWGHGLRLSGNGDAPKARGLVHFGALVLALPAGAFLLWRYGTGGGLGLYTVALVGLFAVSASYHLWWWSPGVSRRMSQADHSMIFVFIAASVTPYCLLGVRGELSDVVLGLVWFVAGGAVLVIATRFDANRRLISMAYLLCGWLAALTLPEAVHHLSAQQLSLMASLAFMYTAGAGVLAAKWPDPAPKVFGYHEVWHAMVVLGSACGFALVWSFAASRH